MGDGSPNAEQADQSEQSGTVPPSSGDTTDSSAPISKTHLASGGGSSNQKLLPIGQGYRLFRKIGAGAFGVVWHAQAPGGVDVAIKMIMRPLDHKAAQTELQALNLIKGMRHAFLLQTQAFWSLEDQLIIVTELADGSLRDRMKEVQVAGKQGLESSELIPYLRESAEALDYLHSRGIIHRDIKPENILLLNGHAKVADFGLARIMPDQAQSMVTATLAGTPTYMPPEMWKGRPKPSSDQYSLAIAYAELRLGRTIFSGSNLVEMMKSHFDGRADFGDISSPEQKVLHKAISTDPADRYETCGAFVKALAEAVTAATEPPRFKKTKEAGGTTIGLSGKALAGALCVALLVMIAIVAFRPSGNAPTTTDVREAPIVKREDWTPAEDATLKEFYGNRYYSKILCKTPAGDEIPFLLIDPPPEGRLFYIMENKVSNGQFARFADTHMDIITPTSKWTMGAVGNGRSLSNKDPDLPVFHVRAEEAWAYARWLNGNLPTMVQWDKAAGLYDNRKDEGPFKGKAVDLDSEKGEIALNRSEGPMHVGTATKDISEPFHCRDMAGNGQEFTRNLPDSATGQKRFVPEGGEGDIVFLRGTEYYSDKPFEYEDIRNSSGAQIRSKPYMVSAPSISFRVVLEL